jgi:hypothetical protein
MGCSAENDATDGASSDDSDSQLNGVGGDTDADADTDADTTGIATGDDP